MSSRKEKKAADKRIQLVKSPGHTDSLMGGGLFVNNDAEPLGEGMVVRSRSPMIKPIDFPVGKRARGIIKSLITCVAGKGEKGKDKMGCLVEIVPSLDVIGVTVPAVATIMTALEIKQEGEGKDTVFSSRFVGHRIELEKLAARIPSKRGQAAWHFLVAVSDKPATV